LRVTAWLGLGAATLGVGAMLTGSGLAHADAGQTDGSSAASPAHKSDRPQASSARTARSAAQARRGEQPDASQPEAASTEAGIAGSAPVPPSATTGNVSDTNDDLPSTIKRDAKASSDQNVSRPSAAASRLPKVVVSSEVTNAPALAAPAATMHATTKPAATTAAATTSDACFACWGVGAASITQGITTAINHLFNTAYGALDGFPLPSVSALLEGALTLIRRTLFFVPTGVSASQTSSELTVGVNSGSVAYFRQDGANIQVADNPLFWGAQDFVASSVAGVNVGNPGNAGCAGFIFTAGAVDAGLETSGIDSINFGDGAAFGKAVEINGAAGPITLTNAVRSAQGVSIEGPVILATDVEIDGGQNSIASNVKFTGTVDAKHYGAQSLLVTALGDTEFLGAVGVNAALKSLTTRAIAPLNIVQSDDTKSIPLHYMPNYNDEGKIQVKYGIEVAIGNNAPRYYVFDTGGQGFFAGYNAQYWQGVSLGSNESQVTYTSGNYYDALATTTSVTIGSGDQSVTTQPIQIGAIVSGGNSKKGTTFDFSNPYSTPVDDRFVGDFGASWGVQPVDNQTQGLSSALFQLPGQLSTGFLVQLGPIGSDQKLTVGINNALRDQFPYAIKVMAEPDGGTYPVSGYQVLDQFGFKGKYYVADPTTGEIHELGTPCQDCSDVELPSLIDSGAPSTDIRWPDATLPFPLATTDGSPSTLKPGMIFFAGYEPSQGRPAFDWEFLSGATSSVDAVGYTTETGAASSTQNVNTGLNLYNGYDVMFDTQLGMIWLRPNGGLSNVKLGPVITTGAQKYGQNAVLSGGYSTGGGEFSVAGTTTLAGATRVAANSGAVTFAGTVDGTTVGGQSLTVNSAGATEFRREVGGLTALASLTTDKGGTSATTGVLTSGSQTYADTTSINGLYQASSFNAGRAATLSGRTKIAVVEGGSIAFGGTLDSEVRLVPTDSGTARVDPGFGLTLQARKGTVNFGAAVGGMSALGGLTIDK
jgi:hypothetical protein